MRVLVIGGTRYMGPRVLGSLVAQGHEVTAFHRGPTLGITPLHLVADKDYQGV